MSSAAAPTYTAPDRHPLGLPPGSVRAMLASQIVLQLCLTLLMPPDVSVRVPLFVHFQMALLFLFFVMNTQARPEFEPSRSKRWAISPAFVRGLLLVVLAVTIGYLGWYKRELLLERMTPLPDQMNQWPLLVACTGGGFLVGYLIRNVPWRNWSVYQDFFAWLSLLCMLLLVADMFISLFINPTLKTQAPFDLSKMEAVLTAFVAAYYGARS